MRMTQHFARGLIVVAASFRCLVAFAADQPPPSVTQLSWLAGCWQSTRGDRSIEEQWMAPRGRTMLGMSRTVTGVRTRQFEYMRIEEREGKLVFTARPSGQEEASFRSSEVTPSSAVFENAAHDFPQRIIYRLNGDGSLTARIEGEQAGKLQGVDFSMRRSNCGTGMGG